MAVEEPPEEQAEGAPAWMTTFADLMSLLMTFFVLLLSFSNTEIIKFRTMAGSMREAFGLRSEFDIMNQPMGSQVMPMPAPSYSKKPTPISTPQKTQTQTKTQEQTTMVKLREALEGSELEKQGNVEITDRGVALRLEGDAIFSSGKTDLTPGARKLMDELIEIAKNQSGTIEVEGHTDDVPIRSSRFPSNWELSAGRAGAAVRYITERGVPQHRLKAIAFGETQPLVPNDSSANRSKNRRIEFLFVSEAPAAGEDAPDREVNNP